MNDSNKQAPQEDRELTFIGADSEKCLMNGNQRAAYMFMNVPNEGFLYTHGGHPAGHDNAAREIATFYAQRQNKVKNISQSSLANISGVMDLLAMFSSAMDLATSGLSIPVASTQHVIKKITFKNDADIILMPGHVVLPPQSSLSSAIRPLFPGESCSIDIINQNAQVNSRLSFSFSAISTNPRVLPVGTENPPVLPIQIEIGRSDGRMGLSRVFAYEQNGREHSLPPGANNSQTNGLQYIAFRAQNIGRPSFGIACMPVTMNQSRGSEMGIQIVFTPHNRF